MQVNSPEILNGTTLFLANRLSAYAIQLQTWRLALLKLSKLYIGRNVLFEL